LYPAEGVTGREMVDWYAGTFGFRDKEGQSSFFMSSSGPGRIEVMKDKEFDKPHIAVRVTNFELACRILEQKGIKLDEPKIKDDIKAVFLKDADPAGNRIHLLWMR
jgi:catechol 2,3-dioxygenase-like lactoylglutathione lyase family enzyme